MPSQLITERPNKTLELTDAVVVQATDGVTYHGTISDIVDLLPAATTIPAQGVTYDNANDQLAFGDSSNSDALTMLPAADILAAAGALVTSGDITSGHYNIGAMQFRWGTVTVNQTAAQNFTFAQSFSNECFGVVINWKSADQTDALHVLSWNQFNFTIDRNAAETGNQPTFYIAVGR